MPIYSAQDRLRLEQLLKDDPRSMAFTALAEAYRQENRLEECIQIARVGLRYHPKSTSGWVILGRVYLAQNKLKDARHSFAEALEISPENVLALQLLGDLELSEKNSKEALKIFKRLLFFHPNSERALQVISKLESITADEYAEETFAMTKLTPLKKEADLYPQPKPAERMQRVLSLVDAWLVRNDDLSAWSLLTETEKEFGDHPEIKRRRSVLQRRKGAGLAFNDDSPEPISPNMNREEQIRQKKLEVLNMMLRRVEEARRSSLL